MENLKYVGQTTFYNTKELTQVNMPAVETIIDAAFQESGLTHADFPNLTSVGDWAFANSALQAINAPKLSTIGSYSFGNTGLTELNFPQLETLATDDESAFKDVSSLSKVTLGIKDTSELAPAFADSKESITSFTLNNVTETPDLADEDEASTKGFASFTQLANLAMPKLTDVGAYTFYNAPTIPPTAFDSKDGQGNEVPGSVQTIGYKAFSGIKNQSIIKTSQVVKLDDTAFKDSSVKVLLLPQGNIQDRLVQKYFDNNTNILGVIYGTKAVDVPVKLDEKASFGQENVYNADTAGVGTTYQWVKGNETLANVLPKYEIAHFTAQDSGTYTQSVQFALGDDQSEFYKVSDYNVHEPVAPAKTPELQPVYDVDQKLSGVTSPNATVYLTDKDGQLKLSTATSDAEGKFVLNLPSTYKAGTTLYVKAHTEAGDSAIAQAVVRESVETPTVNPMLEGDTAISGTGKAGNTIVVSDGINEIGNTTVKEDGTYSLTIPAATADKQYKVYAMNSDKEKSEEVIATVAASKGSITPDSYHIGEANITGTYEGNVASIRFSLGGKYVSRGGDFKDGKFTYYCGAGKIKAGNTVKLEAFDRNNQLLDTKTFKPAIENKATITDATYQVGTSQLTGKYTGDIKKAKLTVNGKVLSWGGTFANGNMSYYVKAGTIKVGDKVTIQAYDQFDSPLSEPVNVTVSSEATGKITNAVKKLGATTIEGTYEGNVGAGQLKVNDKVISYGGTFKDGHFSYYVGQLAIKDTDKVTLTPLDSQKQPVGEPVVVTIEKGNATISDLTYKLGTTQITGTYEGAPTKGQLFVNGKSISLGGTFADGRINYYVKAGTIKDDQT
ncbi:MAG: leucine-rich repeat protein, partial [Leuconostoc sp.]|nr:leucine-rich repeat protein [Leuconostoc sp.]